MSDTKFQYDNPVWAVFLRTLAWERYEANINPNTVGDIEEKIQQAYSELGCSVLRGRASQIIHQKLIPSGYLKKDEMGKSYSPAEKGWADQWQLLNLPMHSEVRRLSFKPVIHDTSEADSTEPIKITLSLRNSALPHLDIFFGTDNPTGGFIERRNGIEILGGSPKSGLYFGKTSNINTRMSDHKKKKDYKWWMFFSIVDFIHLSSDTLETTEALLTAFWKEIAVVDTKKVAIHKPALFQTLQESILLTTAISASLLWLVRDGHVECPVGLLNANSNLKIPFLRPGLRGWPDCYMEHL